MSNPHYEEATVLDEALPPEATLFDLAVDLPALWAEQRGRIWKHSS